MRLLKLCRLLRKHIEYLAVLRFEFLRLFFFGLHDFFLLCKLGLNLSLALDFSNISTGVSVTGYACFCFTLGKRRFQLFDAVICFNSCVLRLLELFNYWRSRRFIFCYIFFELVHLVCKLVKLFGGLAIVNFHRESQFSCHLSASCPFLQHFFIFRRVFLRKIYDFAILP